MYRYLVKKLAVPLNKEVYHFILFGSITDLALKNLAKDLSWVSDFASELPLTLLLDRN